MSDQTVNEQDDQPEKPEPEDKWKRRRKAMYASALPTAWVIFQAAHEVWQWTRGQ